MNVNGQYIPQMKKFKLSILIAGLILYLVTVPAWVVSAHPGQLDSKGCHEVHTRYTHPSGKIDEIGSYHCHRSLHPGGMVLDGKEQLVDIHPEKNPRASDPTKNQQH